MYEITEERADQIVNDLSEMVPCRRTSLAEGDGSFAILSETPTQVIFELGRLFADASFEEEDLIDGFRGAVIAQFPLRPGTVVFFPELTIGAPRCALCEEPLGDERAEMFDPEHAFSDPVICHPECGLAQNLEIA